MKRAEDLTRVYDSSNPQATCERLEFCNEYNVKGKRYGEFPVDFDYMVKTVNKNPYSTWVAGDNDKFKGASFKEIQGTGFKTLKEGQRVEFVSVRGQKGMQATQIKPL